MRVTIRGMTKRLTSSEVIGRYGISSATLARRVAAGELHPIRNPLCRRENLFDPAEVNAVFGTPEHAQAA